MTQHDFAIADGPGLAVRLDLQDALQALATCNSGPTPPVTGVTGENDAYTKVLLHCNGPDGSTVFDDVNTGGAIHVWTPAGNAQIDIGQHLFGGSSAYFDGTGDWISTPDHADFALSNKDFTIDFWFRINAGDNVGLNFSGQSDAGAQGNLSSFYIQRSGADNKIYFAVGNGIAGSMSSLVSASVFTVAAKPGWHHLAGVRSGNMLYLFIDGVQEASGSFSATIPDSTDPLMVGNRWSGGVPMNGWMQEFRLSVGIARWTAPFTPPATAYGGGRLAGMLWLDTSVPPNGQLKMRNQANTAWISIVGFPPKASSAEVIAGTDDSKYVTPKGVSDRTALLAYSIRNRLVNPAMQISQENGDNALTIPGSFPADEWNIFPGAGTVTYQRVALTTPKGSKYRLRMTITTGSAGSYLYVVQRLEGFNIADFLWGAVGARQVIIRFGFKGPAGTYSFAIRNNLNDRSYVKNFTIAAGQANTDTEQVFIVPGELTGTWNIDETMGLSFLIATAINAGLLGVEGWQSANRMGTAANTDGLATTGNVFEIFDLGLYLDLLNSGIPPLWEMPDEPDELLRCQRYYCGSHYMLQHQIAAGASNTYYAMSHAAPMMRSGNPSISGANVAASNCVAGFGASTFFTNNNVCRETRLSSAVGAIYWESTAVMQRRM